MDERVITASAFLFLTHAIACNKLAEASGKTPRQIEAQLNAEARSLLADDTFSAKQVGKVMKSIMSESEV